MGHRDPQCLDPRRPEQGDKVNNINIFIAFHSKGRKKKLFDKLTLLRILPKGVES